MKNVPKRIDGIVSHRIQKRDGNRIVLRHNRHDAVALGEFRINRLGGLVGDGIGIEMAVFEAELLGNGTEHLVLANRSAGKQHVQRRLIGRLH